MEKQKKDRYAQVDAQVMRIRKIYSQIGEPLPADVIIDLYQHLDHALEAAHETDVPYTKREKPRRQIQ